MPPVTGPDRDPAKAARASPLLAELSEAHAARLLAATRRRVVEQGERLIVEGAVSENLYLVLRGRFTVLAGELPIAVIGAGEPIGEIGFFAGSVRSASVVAARNSEVLVLSREDWDGLAQDVPGIALAVLAVLARRLGATTRSAPVLRPLEARSVALNGRVPPALRDPLLAALQRIDRWEVIGPDDPDPRARLHRIEAAGRKVLMLAPPVVLFGDVDAIYDVAPLNGVPERGAGDPSSATLVLWRDRGDDPIAGTRAWLDVHGGARHHHVALDRAGDIDRLARFIDGTALGLVLSGGGAQGTAHLGALKALAAHGIAFDTIGGTSAGAAMGAALALDRDPDDVMALCEDIFLRARAMGRYTIPKYSVLDPARFDAALRQNFGDRQIEDLARPYFAVATSLSTNDMAVLDRGPLWEAVRASTSIPVVFPPWIADGGEILVDGALIDNAPILAMRARKPGPAVLLNLLRPSDWRSGLGYTDLPGRAGILWEVTRTALRRERGGAGFPGAVAVLSRAFNVNAQKRLRGVDAPGDVLIDIAPLDGMQFLDWTRARAQFEASFQAFADALDAAAAAGHSARDPVAMLAAAKPHLPWNRGGGETGGR